MKNNKKLMTFLIMLLLAGCNSNNSTSTITSNNNSTNNPTSTTTPSIVPPSTIDSSNSTILVPPSTNDSTEASTTPAPSTELPKVEHNVSLQNTEHGMVSISKDKAYKDELITVTVVADQDYELENLIVSTGDTEIPVNKEDNGYSFIMPDEDVTITATFKLITSISVNFYNPDTINNYEGELATLDNMTPFFPEGMLVDVTDVSRVGVGRRGGISFGSSSAYGGMRLVLNEKYRLNGVSINATNWSDVDGGLLVNGQEPDFGEIEAVAPNYDLNSNVRWEFNEDTSTNEVYIHTAGDEGHFRAVMYSITFYFTFDTKYDIQVTNSEFGSITAPTKAYKNNVVSFEVQPIAHHAVQAVEVKQGDTAIEVTNNTFVMPEGNVTITATYVEIATFEVAVSENVDETKGKVILTNTEYYEGDTVDVTIIEAPGYKFKELVVTNTSTGELVNSTEKTFEMPNANVKVNATFEEITNTYTASFYSPETMSNMTSNGHAPTLIEMQKLFPENKLSSFSCSKAGYQKRGGLGIGSGSASGNVKFTFSEDFVFDKVDIVAVRWAKNDGSLLVNGLEPTTGTLTGLSTDTTYDCENVVSYQLPEGTNTLTLSTAGVTGQYRCIVFAVTFHFVEQ